jgi:ketopantoate hydroxymethyltransferase
MENAMEEYVEAVESGEFPTEDHSKFVDELDDIY